MGTSSRRSSGKGFAKGPLGMTGTTLDTLDGNDGHGWAERSSSSAGSRPPASGCGSDNSPSGQITRLTLNFAPEPGLLALLGAGAAARGAARPHARTPLGHSRVGLASIEGDALDSPGSRARSLLALALGCTSSVNPATGRREVVLMSAEDEQRIDVRGDAGDRGHAWASRRIPR